jgi:hypothetical protein
MSSGLRNANKPWEEYRKTDKAAREVAWLYKFINVRLEKGK